MIADLAFKGGRRVHLITTLSEFREHVEWLELIAADDGCARDWRETLDRLDPPDPEDEE